MSDETHAAWEPLDLVLILFAPFTQVILLAAAYVWGANWVNGIAFVVVRLGIVALQLLAVAATVALLIWQRRSTVEPSPQRNFASTFLIFTVALSLLLPWGGVFGWLRTQGRHQMEASLPTSALAEECLELVKRHVNDLAAAGGTIDVPEPYSPTIAKLGHVAVWIDLKGVFIAEMGGFDHYGYHFQKSPDGRWILSWFSETETEPLVTLPAGSFRPLGESD